MSLAIEPYAGPAPVVQVIQDARKTVDLNVYYLSSREILNALRSAHARGVAVRVILDQHPYGMKPRMIQKEARNVQATGAIMKWAPSRFEGRYVFDHAKYVCNGHECEIGTANFDWSAFHRNREYLYTTHNARLVQAATEVFDADWSNRHAPAWTHRALVLSPGTSESQLASIIQQPGPIEIESEELGDDRAVLDAMAGKGNQLRIILPSSISAQDHRNAAWLAGKGVKVRLLPKRPVYLHAKMEISGYEAFIGSENFSASSLDRNREMGVILEKPADLLRLKEQFIHDWESAAPLQAGTAAQHHHYRHTWGSWHHNHG